MSDWVNAEMERFRSEKDIERQGNDLVNISNYWVRLLFQISKDVDSINELPDFDSVLHNKSALRFTHYSDYYLVQMTTRPSVNISIKNGGKTLTVRTIIDSFDENDTDNEVMFNVISKDGRVYLESKGEFFIVPEQASERILKPILEELKKLIS